MANIYYSTPYSLEKNLGRAYNEEMARLPKDSDWMCFVDSDTCFLMPDYGHQIHNIVERHPEAGMLTCLTNRVGCIAQLHEGKMSEISDIKYHKRIAAAVQKKYWCKVKKINIPISGVMMIMQKKLWKKIPFSEKLGILGVDNLISKKILAKGYPIYLMRGVYIFHYYRMIEGIKYKKHLK